MIQLYIMEDSQRFLIPVVHIQSVDCHFERSNQKLVRMPGTRRRVGRVSRIHHHFIRIVISLRRLTAPLQTLFRIFAQLFQTALLVFFFLIHICKMNTSI